MTIMNRWFEEVWNQGRESAIDEMSYHDVHGHGLHAPDGNEVHGMDSFKAYYRQMRAALSDIHVTVEDVVTEGDLIVARCTVTAKHTGDGLGKPPKGNPIQFTGMTMARIKEGKIAEAWNNFDFMTMYQQMD
ncbi:MAG TPA: ester cyclase [Acidobacteriaceae bacterium]